ncbi:hypothetical protein HDU83_008962 [Entophlyctis luteolus]|nr:hypothetical protein HDU83_008962 [Entophlyctis luteolus]
MDDVPAFADLDDYSEHSDSDAAESGDEDMMRDVDDGEGDGSSLFSQDEDDEVLLGLRRVDTVAGLYRKEPLYTVSVHPTLSDVAVSGGGDDAAFVWSTDTGEILKELQSHTDSVVASGFSHDGQYLATGGMDGRVFVYLTSTGERILELEGPAEVTWLNWHPRGNALLCGSSDATLWMWSIPSGQCMNVFTGHSASITCGQFSPDGKSVLSGAEDGNLYQWDPRTATPKQIFRSDDARFLSGASVTSLSVHSDSAVALAGGADGSSCLVALQSGKVLGSVSKCEDSVESVGFSSHLPVAGVSSIDGSIALWDIQLMRLRQTLRHPKGVTKIMFMKQSPLLLSCSLDKTVRLWDLRTGNYERSFYGHTGPILDMAISGSADRIVTCGEDGSAQVFMMQ